jgi:hypothetical protein
MAYFLIDATANNEYDLIWKILAGKRLSRHQKSIKSYTPHGHNCGK